MGNPFYTYFYYWSKRTDFLKVMLGILFNQICFWIWFWTLESALTKKTHESESARFLHWTLPKVQNQFQNQILLKSIPNYIVSQGNFNNNLKKLKIDFQLYFKIVILKWPKVLEFLVHILLESHPVPLAGWHVNSGPL